MMKRPSNIAVFGLIAIGAWLIMTYGVKQPNPNLKRLMENRMEQTLGGEKAAANRGGADGLDTPSVAGIGGPFSLIDQHGGAVTEADFRGDFMLVNFGFTGCPDICPMQLEAMSAAVDALGADGARVRPVFITIDPERDTIGRMAEFAQNFHPRLIALTAPAGRHTKQAFLWCRSCGARIRDGPVFYKHGMPTALDLATRCAMCRAPKTSTCYIPPDTPFSWKPCQLHMRTAR